MCAQYQENLHHRRNAATDWGKRSKAECNDDYDYSGDLPRGNGSICISDAIADEHPCGTHAQEDEAPAGRAGGEHRKQSLHDLTITGARVCAESYNEASVVSPFEGVDSRESSYHKGNSRALGWPKPRSSV